MNNKKLSLLLILIAFNPTANAAGEGDPTGGATTKAAFSLATSCAVNHPIQALVIAVGGAALGTAATVWTYNRNTPEKIEAREIAALRKKYKHLIPAPLTPEILKNPEWLEIFKNS